MLHEDMRVALVQPRERGGKLVAQRYRQQTPAMAAGRTRRRRAAREVLWCPLPPVSARMASELDEGLSHVAGRRVKRPAEKLGGSLTLEREDLSGMPHHQKQARNGFAAGCLIYPPSSMVAAMFYDTL